MLFKNKLYYILNDLADHKRSPAELLEISIQERLDSALKAYQKSLDDSYQYLSRRDNINVLKKINRQGD